MKAVKVLTLLIDGEERNFGLYRMSISCKYTSAMLVLLLSSPKHGAHIQISQPLVLSGLYPQIQSFHKLANFQHFMLASG